MTTLSLRDLQITFPYQFSGQSLGVNVARGWMPIFAQLCSDIDTALGSQKRGFYWRQVKEKWGSLRASFRLNDGVYEREEGLVRSLFDLVGKAEKSSQIICAACGEPGRLDTNDRYLIALCQPHRDQLLVGIAVPIWATDEEAPR
jgi:hypothetical protein